MNEDIDVGRLLSEFTRAPVSRIIEISWDFGKISILPVLINWRGNYCPLWLRYHGNTGCQVSKQEVQNHKDFCIRINRAKGNYWILRIGIVTSCQKLGIILVTKLFKNWRYQKMCSFIDIFQWKRIEKDSIDFWHRKLTLKIIFWWFLSHHTQVNASPITKITSWLKFLGKNLHLVGCATVCGKSKVMLMILYLECP